MLVRMVTPINFGTCGFGVDFVGLDSPNFDSSLAFAAARIISIPPRVCTLSRRTPGKEIALETAPLTVLGMS